MSNWGHITHDNWHTLLVTIDPHIGLTFSLCQVLLTAVLQVLTVCTGH